MTLEEITKIEKDPPRGGPQAVTVIYKLIDAFKEAMADKERLESSAFTKDAEQKYFEEGYDQCFREVIEEIKTWNHPDTKSFIMWLSKTFKLSAAKL